MQKISNVLDNFSERTGKLCSWLVACMILITCLVVVMRYGLSMGSVMLQDVVLYLHGALFLLCAAFALKRQSHVRVDVFYRDFSARKKALVDLVGNLVFLQPMCWLVLIYSWGYVKVSWRIWESSPDPLGLPFVYLQKSLLIALCLLLLIQSLSEIIKSYGEIRRG